MLLRLNVFFTWFNRQPTALIIFLLCIANFFGFSLEGGEEQYFAFAKQYMDPSWMPHSFTLNHPAGGNLTFQVITGFLLRYLSFEQLAAWGRSVNFLLYAIPLALIFRRLRITNIEVVFLLQVIFFGHQSLYAGEWIFKNFEEKTLAYLFVFWALYFVLKNKPGLSAASTAAATYFHFLVGGWMFAFVFIYFLIHTGKLRTAIMTGAIYVTITLPFVIYLFNTYMKENSAVVDGINTNWVYVYWRLKHHIGLFYSARYFFSHHFTGVFITLILFALCIFVFRKYKDPGIQKLNLLNIIIFSQQFLFLIIGLFDSQGVLLKTYPYRTNSLSFLLFLMELTLVFRYNLINRHYRLLLSRLMQIRYKYLPKLNLTGTLNLIFMVVFVPVFIFETYDMFRKLNNDKSDGLNTNMYNLISYAGENTPREAVFLFLNSDKPLSFIRRAQRERFVVYKFTPTRSEDIADWYKRSMAKENLQQNIGLIDSVRTIWPVHYLVSDSIYHHPTLKPEKQFGPYMLYRVE